MARVPASIHDLLAVQHGHVARSQLYGESLTANQIKHLVRRGDLIPERRGVYRTPSAAVTELGRCAALCLGRPGLVIAGPTAGRIWGFRNSSNSTGASLVVLQNPMRK